MITEPQRVGVELEERHRSFGPKLARRRANLSTEGAGADRRGGAAQHALFAQSLPRHLHREVGMRDVDRHTMPAQLREDIVHARRRAVIDASPLTLQSDPRMPILERLTEQAGQP